MNNLDLKTPAQTGKLSGKQKEIYKELLDLLNVEPATFFSDACKIMKDEVNLEAKTNLVSHLVREIISTITDKLKPDGVEKKLPKKDRNKSLVNFIAEEQGIDKNNQNIIFWREVLADSDKGLYKYVHRSNEQGIKKVDQFFLEYWENIQSLIYFQTQIIKNNVIDDYKKLDEYLEKETLTRSDISNLKSKIPLNYFTLKYFFEKSKHYEQLSLLKESGFFDYSTPPKEHESGGLSLPDWPQLVFLMKASKIDSLQDLVLDICLSVDTDNSNVQQQVIDLIIGLPIKKVVSFKKNAENWLNTQKYFLSYKSYGELISQYARNGFCDEAIDLMASFLQIKPDPRDSIEVDGHKFGHDPIGIVNKYDYQEFIKEYVPLVVKHCEEKAIAPLLSILENYLKIENKQKGYKKDDYSDIWRPSIDKNSKHGLNNYLVTSIRDSSLQILHKHPEKLLDVLKLLDKSYLNVARRIKLYLLYKVEITDLKNNHKTRIRKELLNKIEYGDRGHFNYEYYQLAKKYSEILTESQKDKIWNYIQNPPKSDRKEFVEYWQSSRIKSFLGFGGKWKDLYEKNIKISGEPKYRNEETKVYTRRVEDKSPISIEKLKQMNPDEALDFIKDWKSTDNDPLERTLDGMTIALATTVEENPTNWLKVIQKIIGLDKAYVRSYFDGFLKARKSGKSFAWLDLLTLAKNILKEHPAEKDKNEGSKIGFDPSWSWCRRTIADLVLDGLKDNKNNISIDSRKAVWEVVELLLKDPDPDESRAKSVEQEHLERSRDFLTTAINSIRGVAIEAAIEYGIWLKLKLSEEEQKKWHLEVKAPELSQALKYHLDPTKDKSPAIRAIYGQQLMRLTWLDAKWMIKHKKQLFPQVKGKELYFNAAWESYVCYVDPRKQMLDIYEDEYRRAIGELGSRADSSHHPVSPDQSLVQHLSFLYLWEFLDFNKDGIWDDFYNDSPVEAKTEVINFLGRSLSDWSDMKIKTKKRLISVVEKRLEFVKSLEKSKREPQEFEGLGRWFVSNLFPIDWRFKVMLEAIDLGCIFEGAHLIIETLSETVKKYPLKSAKLCKHVADNDKKGWGIISWREYLFTILDTAMQGSDEVAKEIAIETIKTLMSKGYLHFKEILDKHNV